MSQILTRFGESGVYGFLPALDSRPAAQLLLQSISTEARQQMIFRQLAGAFPMPVWFESGISQSMAWTLLSPYLVSCPASNPKIKWNSEYLPAGYQNSTNQKFTSFLSTVFPSLEINNNPNLTAEGVESAVSTNRTAFVTPGVTKLELTYEAPGLPKSYNQSGNSSLYTSALGKNVTQTENLTCVFIAQLNATNVPFQRTGNNSGTCLMPNGTLFSQGNPILNDTNFILLTSESIYVTPYNLSLLDDVIVAGPAVVVYG
jgi:hypothetical protein